MVFRRQKGTLLFCGAGGGSWPSTATSAGDRRGGFQGYFRRASGEVARQRFTRVSLWHKVCVPASPRLCLLSNEDLNRFEALGLRIIDRSSPLTQPRLTRSNLLS